MNEIIQESTPWDYNVRNAIGESALCLTKKFSIMLSL